MAEKNTLGLAGDLDDVEMIEAVESCFDIKIENEEAEILYNVGGLYDLVIEKLGPPAQPSACFSAYVFYALRCYFRDRYPEKRIAPDVLLRDLTNKRHNEDLWAAIEAGTHLKLPNLTYGCGYWLSWLIVVVSCILLLAADDKRVGGWMLVAGAAGVLAFRFDHGIIPFSKRKTLKSLVHSALTHNFGSLKNRLGGYRKKEAWDTLLLILEEQTAIAPSSINRETVFF
jgi:hypothetical protein